MKPLFVLTLALALIGKGCTPLENRARDAAAAAQGFIEQAQKDHPECKQTPTKPWPCVAISQAVGAQNLLIDSIEAYCGWPVGVASPVQPCLKKAEYAQRLNAAINSINQILKDYRQAAQ